jgi:hypothetical protein
VNEQFSPRRVNDKTRNINITGYLMPWDVEFDQPVYLPLTGTPDQFILVFRAIIQLEEFCSIHVRNKLYKIKHIDDGIVMINSLPYWLIPDEMRLRIMVDPWITEKGTIRFIEIIREES